MSSQGKDTIYIDVDEEITAIVNKIQSSQKSIVALVLPKRAAVLQSIVNMKLLKRTADQTDKQVVLITSEGRLLPLAGAAGLFVASTLTSKPYVPSSPRIAGEPLGSGPEDLGIDPATPVSALAPDANFADEDSIEIDNRQKDPVASASAAVKSSDPKKDNKKKVPSFSSFRKKIIFGVLALLLLIFGLIYALAIAPKATVTLKAQTSEVPVNLSFIADTEATEADKEEKIVRATAMESEKTDSEEVGATGEKDKGNKASGTVTLKNCEDVAGNVKIPAGTGISSGEFTFITQKAVTLPPSIFSGGNHVCLTSTVDVSVIAQESGDKYNLSPRSYTVAGHPKVIANGSTMSGGTSDIVKVISAADVDKAKERLNSKQNTTEDEISKELINDGYVPIADSFESKPAKYEVTPAIGTEASKVTVSVKTKFTMVGVKKDDLKELINEEVKKKQDGQPQSILSDGIDKAVIKPSSVSSVLTGSQKAYSADIKVVIGPDLNQDELKNLVTGKKKGEAEELLKKISGVSDPSVQLKPFWVAKIPKASKITIEIQQADGSQIP